MDSFCIRRATAADLPFIMATERQAGYEDLVGRWDEQRHLAALEDGRFAYFLGEIDGTAIGFSFVRDWASPERVTCVKRIAVVHPGRGAGRRLLGAVVEEIFQTTQAHRVWLGVYPENARARRAYEAVGFQPEGIARGSAFFNGRYRDELIMSILRDDWRPTSTSARIDT
jgi:RimJ/RimL family protein N-acetyltransferase